MTQILRELIVKRRKVGPASRAGHLLSNLIKQVPWLNDTTGNRSWAKHPSQDIRWWMNVQISTLENEKRAAP